MIKFSDGTIEHEEEDFIDTPEWHKYLREQNNPGATFIMREGFFNKPKLRTVADELNENFGYFVEGHEFERLPFDKNIGDGGLKETMKLYNKRESDMMDAVRYGIWPSAPVQPPSLLEKFWAKITWPLGLIIVHEDNICDCEDY